MKKLNKNGISLIVLVITIIVMIILATAIILTLNGSKILEKAKESKTENDVANIKEAATVEYANYLLEINSGKVDKNITSGDTYVKGRLKQQGFSEETLKTLMVTKYGKIYMFKIPNGFVASSVSTEDEISEGLVIYEGTEPVTSTNVSTAKTTRNQYVWIPVEESFTRVNWLNEENFEENYTEPFSKTMSNGITLSITNDLTGEYAEYIKMRASVEKYGGFYVARYEAGIETINSVETIVSRKGKSLCVVDDWGDSMTEIGTTGAVYKARNIYPETTNKEIVSTLIYGVQWDAIMNFMKDVPNPNVEGKKYIEDSTGMGNYQYMPKSGLYDSYMVKNIYDMAGNMDELTMEAKGVNMRVQRGGCAHFTGSAQPASFRITGHLYPGGVLTKGFRVALYLK